MGEELAFCLIIERSTEPMITGRTVGRERRWRTGHGWEACLRGLWGSVQVEDGRWIGNDVILCVVVGIMAVPMATNSITWLPQP
jgi:hypothetical protein